MAPAAAIAQDQLDANIISSCTATINGPASDWLALGTNPPGMSVDVLCNVGYAMTLDDYASGVRSGHMTAYDAGAQTGIALANRLLVTSADAVNAPLDGPPVAIIAPKPRDLDELPESYVLSYTQVAAPSDPVLTSGSYRMVLLFSLTQIPN